METFDRLLLIAREFIANLQTQPTDPAYLPEIIHHPCWAWGSSLVKSMMRAKTQQPCNVLLNIVLRIRASFDYGKYYHSNGRGGILCIGKDSYLCSG